MIPILMYCWYQYAYLVPTNVFRMSYRQFNMVTDGTRYTLYVPVQCAAMLNVLKSQSVSNTGMCQFINTKIIWA